MQNPIFVDQAMPRTKSVSPLSNDDEKSSAAKKTENRKDVSEILGCWLEEVVLCSGRMMKTLLLLPCLAYAFLTKSQFYVGMPFFLYCARELIQVSSGIGVGILTIKLLLLTKWVSTGGELMLNLSWHLEVMFIHIDFF